MPIFDRKEKPQTRELLDIIFDMLTTDVPEDKIISMLEQMGMGKEEARKTLSAAKQKYDALIQSSLAAAVDRLLAKEKDELMERVDSKVESLKRDLLLKMEMESPEKDKYLDKKLAPVISEVGGLKSDLFSSKIEINARLKALEDLAGKKEKRAADVLLPVILMIVGLAVMFFAASQLRDMLMNFDLSMLVAILLYSIVMVIGLTCIYVGFTQRPTESKVYKPAGLEYVK